MYVNDMFIDLIIVLWIRFNKGFSVSIRNGWKILSRKEQEAHKHMRLGKALVYQINSSLTRKEDLNDFRDVSKSFDKSSNMW